jgi:hypothetical protein
MGSIWALRRCRGRSPRSLWPVFIPQLSFLLFQLLGVDVLHGYLVLIVFAAAVGTPSRQVLLAGLFQNVVVTPQAHLVCVFNGFCQLVEWGEGVTASFNRSSRD